MLIKELKRTSQISSFLKRVAFGQNDYEQSLNKIERKKNGVFLTNSLDTVENLLNVVVIDSKVFSKKILNKS